MGQQREVHKRKPSGRSCTWLCEVYGESEALTSAAKKLVTACGVYQEEFVKREQSGEDVGMALIAMKPFMEAVVNTQIKTRAAALEVLQGIAI